MSKLPTPDDLHSLVIRTDFTDEAAWQVVRQELAAANGPFRANLQFIDDRRFDQLTVGAGAGRFALLPARCGPSRTTS